MNDTALGGTWNSDDVILFSQPGGIFRVSANGGKKTQVTTADSDTGHNWPHFLPDGRRYLYSLWTRQPDSRAIYVGSLDSDMKKLLTYAESMPMYAPPGFLLFHRQGSLLAQRFDAERLELSGKTLRVADEIGYYPVTGRAGFSVSSNGVLIYRTGGMSTGLRQFLWIDRENGKAMAPVGKPTNAVALRLSPDSKRIAYAKTPIDGTVREDIWIYDINRDFEVPLTRNPALDHGPIWSHDGSQIGFDSGRGEYSAAAHALYTKPSNGAAEESLLLKPEPGMSYGFLDWSLDGRYIIYQRGDTQSSKLDLWVMPLFGDRTPFRYDATPANEVNAAISPNGKWLAYTSNESGMSQVIVRTFPQPSGEKSYISREGGVYPRWSRDGRELYYLDPKGQIVAVSVATEEDFRIEKETVLFQTPINFPNRQPSGPAYPYDVTADGRQFLILAPLARTQSVAIPITVVLNWTASLKR